MVGRKGLEQIVNTDVLEYHATSIQNISWERNPLPLPHQPSLPLLSLTHLVLIILGEEFENVGADVISQERRHNDYIASPASGNHAQ
jgi:hypothetical protein